jgi:hypothetical protein
VTYSNRSVENRNGESEDIEKRQIERERERERERETEREI